MEKIGGQEQRGSPHIDIEVVEKGFDSLGNCYGSIREMWSSELETRDKNEIGGRMIKGKVVGSTKEWYENAVKYWGEVSADNAGVMGGFQYTHDDDINDSNILLEFMKRKYGLGIERALDCGAGVGRITKHFLSHHFKKTDILEPSRNLMEAAQVNLKDNERVGEYYEVGMQDMTFEHKYDIIWIQWVIGHLTDGDLKIFLEKCKGALTDDGVIVVKDNAVDNCSFYLDKTDFSIARSMEYFEKLFNKAGYVIVYSERFKDFPTECMPVMKMVLFPKEKVLVDYNQRETNPTILQ